MSASQASPQHVSFCGGNDGNKTAYPVLAIKEHRTIILVTPDEIDWIEAAGDYVCIHTERGKHLLREKISQIALRLPAAQFARIHRSTVVNLSRVMRVRSDSSGETLVHLSTGDRLHVSRPFKQVLLQRLNAYEPDRRTLHS